MTGTSKASRPQQKRPEHDAPLWMPRDYRAAEFMNIRNAEDAASYYDAIGQANPFYDMVGKPDFTWYEVRDGIESASLVLQLALRLHLKRRAQGDLCGIGDEAAKARLDEALAGVDQNEHMQARARIVPGKGLFLSVYLPESPYTELLLADAGAERSRSVRPPSSHDFTECRRISYADELENDAELETLPFPLDCPGYLVRLDVNIPETIDDATSQPIDLFTLDDCISGLFFVHLAGVRTTAEPSDLSEGRVFMSGLSSIWWEVLDMQRMGHVVECEACTKLFVTKNQEAGKPQKFCSNACRVWGFRNPGKKMKAPRK